MRVAPSHHTLPCQRGSTWVATGTLGTIWWYLVELKIHISNSPVLLRGGEMGQLLWETVWQLLK